MKFNMSLCAVFSALLLTGSFQAMADAPAPVTVHGGQINFTGSVVSTPCAVDVDSDSQIVQLGQVTANSFSSVGASSSPVPFNISLTGCDLNGAIDGSDNYTKASITFNGNTVSGNPLALAVASANGTSDSTAGNVGIQIKQDDVAINVDGSQASTAKPIVVGSNSLAFTASYISTDAAVTAGSANATADFTVTYE